MKSIKLLATALVMTSVLSACGMANKAEHWQGKRAEWQNSVVLINAFEVPKGKEAEALQSWQKARDFLQTQDGYISTQLHQNLDPNGKFHLVNVARLRSADDFKNATAKMREALPDNQVEGVVFYPSLFKVIESDMPFGRKMGK